MGLVSILDRGTMSPLKGIGSLIAEKAPRAADRSEDIKKYGDAGNEVEMSLTKLEYRVWRQADPMQAGGEILQMKSHITMADYHFRVNAERAGIDPRGITTEVHWTGDTECRFSIAADAPSEALSRAWEKSVPLLGLRSELAAEAT